jgi:hypothetical protein
LGSPCYWVCPGTPPPPPLPNPRLCPPAQVREVYERITQKEVVPVA